MASKPTSGNRMRATRVSQRMPTTRPDLGQRLIIWSRRQWMCVFINLNTFPMISLFEFFDKLDERIFPADVAGENDIRQAGKFCLRAQLPHPPKSGREPSRAPRRDRESPDRSL